MPIEKRYPPEWFHDPSAGSPRMELEDVPVADTWGAMEKLHAGGLVKNIGVANFNCQGIRDLVSYAKVKPSVLQVQICFFIKNAGKGVMDVDVTAPFQVELHPMLQQRRLVRYAQSLGMHVTAFSPLGHGLSYWNDKVSALDEPSVREVAGRTGRTPAQVVLRWNLQRGVSVIPKSEREARIAENLDVFGFELSDSDMEALAGAEKGFRFNDPAVFCESAFNTFCPIFD